MDRSQVAYVVNFFIMSTPALYSKFQHRCVQFLTFASDVGSR